MPATFIPRIFVCLGIFETGMPADIEDCVPGDMEAATLELGLGLAAAATGVGEPVLLLDAVGDGLGVTALGVGVLAVIVGAGV
jgi:hypothetical protein